MEAEIEEVKEAITHVYNAGATIEQLESLKRHLDELIFDLV
jgi:hypothetical protein